MYAVLLETLVHELSLGDEGSQAETSNNFQKEIFVKLLSAQNNFHDYMNLAMSL